MSPFFEEWPEENPVVPMDKLMEYLHVNNDLLEEQSCYQHRPYCWSNSVASLDGITSFHEPESTGPAEIALGHIKPAGRQCDFRVLNGSWALADAVLLSAAVLRQELHLQSRIQFPDLEAFSQKRKKYWVVLTESGRLDQDHAFFHSCPESDTILIATGEENLESLSNVFDKLHNGLRVKICIKAFGKDRRADPVLLLHHLRRDLNVRWLDLSAGGQVVSDWIRRELVDEMRITTTTQLCGSMNQLGQQRPCLFPHRQGDKALDPWTNPVLQLKAIRSFGRMHFFQRFVMVPSRTHFPTRQE